MTKKPYKHANEAEKYAKNVISGKILACRWVKLACKRYVKDISRQKYKNFKFEFKPNLANAACEFLESLPHIKGEWVFRRENLKLQPWQKFIFCNIFGWVKKKDGFRRFRDVYVEVPRKNGKSTIAAGLGVYMLVDKDEPFAEVYCCATNEKQAWHVFEPAKLMTMRADGLKDHFGVQVNARNLNIPSDGSRFEPIIARPKDGSSPYCGIVDEYHQHDDAAMYNSLKTGTGARRQPILFTITTAGSNLSGPCYEKRDQICNILEGNFKSDSTFGIIYTIDDEDDWADFRNWKKANPNYGVSVFEDNLKETFLETKQSVAAQNPNRCKHLNQWVNVEVGYFNILAWQKCADKDLKIEEFIGESCFIGIDLASTIDIAAMIILFERDGEYYAFGKYYLPEDTINKPENIHYQNWRTDGRIKDTPGAITDFGFIETELIKLSEMFNIEQVRYDPFQATQFSTRMDAKNFPMVKVNMTALNMSEPMKTLDALTLDGSFHFDGDPVLLWMASNTVGKLDNKDNVYPRKERDKNKIDGIIALLMALGGHMSQEIAKVSKYAQGGGLQWV